MTREQKRENLKQRIEAARARLDDRPPEKIVADAAGEAFDYAKQNPFVAIGGLAAAALALGAFLKRRNKSGASNTLLTRFVTDIAVGFAVSLFDKYNRRDQDEAEVQTAAGQDLLEDTTDH